MHMKHVVRASRKLTAIDLFSGCGGLTQGLKDGGFNVLAAIELDPLAAQAYSLNHRTTRVFNNDIRAVSAIQILESCKLNPGDLDLLAGCPPCQGFSRLHNKNKNCRLNDPRNRLIDEVTRLVQSLLPKVVMLENVPKLARYTRYLNFKRELRRLGYNVSDEVVDVSDFGVPQRRKRLVVLASRVGIIEHLSPIGDRCTVRDAIGDLPPTYESTDPLHNLIEHRSSKIRDLIRAVPKDGGSRSALPSRFSLKCHSELDGFNDVYGRMKWDDVAPTITSGCINPSKGRFLHPEADRAITLREAALLQTFPDNYIFPLTKGKYAVAEMIGNALPPAFSRIQACFIKDHLASIASDNMK